MSKTGSNRACMALIVDENDNVLVGQRNDTGKWTMPGGHAEKGEDAHICMYRELKEETGLDAVDMTICKLVKKGKMFVYVFKVKIDPDQKIDVSGDPDNEVSDWEFKDPNEIVEELHVPLKENTVLQCWMES